MAMNNDDVKIIKLMVPAEGGCGPDMVIHIRGSVVPDVYKGFRAATLEEVATATVYFGGAILQGVRVDYYHE